MPTISYRPSRAGQFYQRPATSCPLYLDSANDGFHEAIAT
jgi:hypothetical protein